MAWGRDQTLEGLVTAKFEAVKARNEAVLKGDKGHPVQTYFNMAYLHKNYGWAVQWVDNLADHLSIDRKNKIVAIYEHKVCLFNHLMYGSGAPIPQAALEEAADTLNLLFPRDDDTRKFLKDEGRDFLEVGLIARADSRDLGDYHYWRKSLSDLVDELKVPPTGLRQITLDTEGRNLYQVLTFWLAVIVGVLAVLSIVFGTVSTVYTIKQYNLAVAQACSTPGAETTLPQYCA
ncbi:hypothetical protein GQ53DRAFT_720370 [Thozetella sp. PMI_491]|nr:hypothetical protein GQ53DRAFT_720370 [Thozetella sp. PMI_491]